MEKCVYQAQWEVHEQTCMCTCRGWALLMGYISQEKVPFHKNKWSLSSGGLKETYIQASKTCLTVSPNEDNLNGGCGAGPLCSAKHSSSFREVTAGSVSKQWVWKPSFGVWASVLDHKCLFWSQLYFRENIFYMTVFQAGVCKLASTHHKNITRKPNRSHPFLHHSAPPYFHVCIGWSKQTGEVTKTTNIQRSDQVYLVAW